MDDSINKMNYAIHGDFLVVTVDETDMTKRRPEKRRLGTIWYNDYGKRLKIRDAAREIRYRYEHEQLSEIECLEQGGDVFLERLIYDNSGNPRERIISRNGENIGRRLYSYDEHNRLIYRSDENGSFTFRYDDSGRIERQIHKRSDMSERVMIPVYDNANHILEHREESVNGHLIRLFRYAYSPQGDIVLFEEVNSDKIVLKSYEYTYPRYIDGDWLERHTIRRKGCGDDRMSRRTERITSRALASRCHGDFCGIISAEQILRDETGAAPEPAEERMKRETSTQINSTKEDQVDASTREAEEKVEANDAEENRQEEENRQQMESASRQVGEIMLNNGVYRGEIANGEMHGSGELVFSDGGCYHGEFEHNKMAGNGIMRWVDGRVYRGEFHANEMHGWGSYSTPDGETIQGEFQHGRFIRLAQKSDGADLDESTHLHL